MDALTTSPSPAVAEPAFVPLSILPDPVDQPMPSSTAVAAQGGPGVMTIEVGSDLLLRIGLRHRLEDLMDDMAAASGTGRCACGRLH
jgi:hypothetical protein